ncbi:unnamed protein product, partial [Cyprideis torosa]
MGPKAPPKSAPKKPQEAKKIAEDKTFGLKNKKGSKVQKYVQNISKQMQGNARQQAAMASTSSKTKKEEEKQKKEELKSLFRPVVQQKVDGQTDPKSVLCAFFKQGLCTKGNKCKFSHDPAVERKVEKRNIYEAESKNEDNMNDWDEDKMNEVITKKHGESNQNKTDIICKHFLEAVENSKYGWFWECPTGDKCIYRHALPQGYVLKKDKKALKDQEETITIEELVEQERAKLNADLLTRVTLETFLEWKKKRRAEKRRALEGKQAKRKADFKSGKLSGLSGRELFTFDPSLVSEADDGGDEEGVFDLKTYDHEEERNGGEGTQLEEPEFKEVAFDESLFGEDLDDLEDDDVEAAAQGVEKIANERSDRMLISSPFQLVVSVAGNSVLGKSLLQRILRRSFSAASSLTFHLTKKKSSPLLCVRLFLQSSSPRSLAAVATKKKKKKAANMGDIVLPAELEKLVAPMRAHVKEQ